MLEILELDAGDARTVRHQLRWKATQATKRFLPLVFLSFLFFSHFLPTYYINPPAGKLNPQSFLLQLVTANILAVKARELVDNIA